MDKAKFHQFHLLELNLTVYQSTNEMVDLDLESDQEGASYFQDRSVQNLVPPMFGLGQGQTDTLIVVHIQVDIHSVAKIFILSLSRPSKQAHVVTIRKASLTLFFPSEGVLQNCTNVRANWLPVVLEVHFRTQEGTRSVHHLGLISRNPRTSYSQDLPF